MALVNQLLKEIEGSSKNGLRKFLKETGHSYEKGTGHILNGSGEKAALQDLVSSYNTKKVVADAAEEVTSRETPIANMFRENIENKNNINNVSDSKFKFSRANGKATARAPVSKEFQDTFEKEYTRVSGESGFKFVNPLMQKGTDASKVFETMGKDSKFKGDLNKLEKGANIFKQNQSNFREAFKNGTANDFKAVTKDISAKNGEKSAFQENMDGVLKKAIPIAVGGGLVFSMFNRGGQQSNSELYGQRQSYGG